jgi:hypothetical protein
VFFDLGRRPYAEVVKFKTFASKGHWKEAIGNSKVTTLMGQKEPRQMESAVTFGFGG